MHGHVYLNYCLRVSYGSPRGLSVPLGEFGSGRERPPFFLPVAGTAALRNLHLRNTPWGGRSRPSILAEALK